MYLYVKTNRLILILILTILSIIKLHATTDSSFILSVSPLYAEYNTVYQPISYKAGNAVASYLKLSCFQNRGEDSICLYNIEFENISFNTGVYEFSLDLNKNTKVNSISYQFLDVIKKFEFFPPGEYTTYITLYNKDTHDSSIFSFVWDIDSTLAYNSEFRNDIDEALQEKTPVSVPVKLKKKPRSGLSIQDINTQTGYLSKKIDKRYHTTSVVARKDNITYNAYYSDEWFLGYYQLHTKDVRGNTLISEHERLSDRPQALVNSRLGGFTGLNTQLKSLNKRKSKQDAEDIDGNITLSSNFSTGQEPNSMQDNNFQEIRGRVGMELFNMPVVIEGYYTTQDNNRKAKASFIRIKYDVEKAKSKLNKSAYNYKNSYENIKAGTGSVTGEAKNEILKLARLHTAVLMDLQKDFNITPDMIASCGCDIDKLSSGLDDSTKKKLYIDKQNVQKKCQQANKSKQRIARLEKQLLQYRNQQYFDSTLSYSKLQKIGSGHEMSAKDLTKASKHFLPQSLTSSVLSGLTRLDIGILNDYESNYTMSGQTLKGGSVGYDLSGVKVTLSAGKTEYISREGNVDRYNTYLLRADLKPIRKQKISFLYYGYTPTKQIINDNSFFKSDAALPSFRQPVHIVSLLHSGTISKSLTIESEGAASYRNIANRALIGKDNWALKTGIIYNIPKTNAELKAEWEHVGKRFENNALPYTRAATERYTLSTHVILFESFLRVGVQYNMLKQETFSSTGYNTKWGFDIQTRSKRYPNIYLSYKPFSTFRRFDDTMAIAQRPVSGSVWIARTSYQIKRKYVNHRFSLSYNRNHSNMDTIRYESQTLQGGYTYTTKKEIINSNIGWLVQPVVAAKDPSGSMRSFFINASITRNMNDKLSLSLGQDIAIAPFGIQRTITSLGTAYSFAKLPVLLFIQTRYSQIRLNETVGHKEIWNVTLGVNYRFRAREPKWKSMNNKHK